MLERAAAATRSLNLPNEGSPKDSGLIDITLGQELHIGMGLCLLQLSHLGRQLLRCEEYPPLPIEVVLARHSVTLFSFEHQLRVLNRGRSQVDGFLWDFSFRRLQIKLQRIEVLGAVVKVVHQLLFAEGPATRHQITGVQ